MMKPQYHFIVIDMGCKDSYIKNPSHSEIPQILEYRSKNIKFTGHQQPPAIAVSCLCSSSPFNNNVTPQKDKILPVKSLARKYLAKKSMHKIISKLKSSEKLRPNSYLSNEKLNLFQFLGRKHQGQDNPPYLSLSSLSFHDGSSNYESEYSAYSLSHAESPSIQSYRPYIEGNITQKNLPVSDEDSSSHSECKVSEESDDLNQYENYQDLVINGRKYKGDVKDGVPHGMGSELWPDGSIYEGVYVNGHRKGQGKLVWADGNSYDGVFDKDELCGYGTFVWKNGDKYEGMFKHSKMHGEGTFTWNNGNRYIGGYSEGIRHGFGIFLWSDGRVNKGHWYQGKLKSK